MTEENRLREMFDWVDAINPRELSDRERIPFDGKGKATPFMDSLLRLISGHTGVTYSGRAHPQELQEINKYLQWNEWNLRYSPERVNPDVRRKAEALVRGGLVVDLGCGISGEGYAICDFLGAKAYLGNELNFSQSADRNLREMRGQVPFRIVQSDMGDFLRNFSSKSWKAKAIFFSGIDKHSYRGSDPYWVLYSLMDQSLEEGGHVVIAGNLRGYNLDLIKNHFEFVEEIREPWGSMPNITQIYRKKQNDKRNTKSKSQNIAG